MDDVHCAVCGHLYQPDEMHTGHDDECCAVASFDDAINNLDDPDYCICGGTTLVCPDCCQVCTIIREHHETRKR